MKKPLSYLLILSFVSMLSCVDKDSFENISLQSLTIDPNSSSFIDPALARLYRVIK